MLRGLDWAFIRANRRDMRLVAANGSSSTTLSHSSDKPLHRSEAESPGDERDGNEVDRSVWPFIFWWSSDPQAESKGESNGVETDDDALAEDEAAEDGVQEDADREWDRE